MTEHAAQVDHRAMANAIRVLAMDAVEAARSGHPGLPMGAADIATVLFTGFLKFDPKEPDWPDRDRFVLSAGHGSMLLYAILHLLGYEALGIEELKRFRQLGSRTPGHPEYDHTPGVETTTGPLGQGLANAVGMAIAERHLNSVFGDDLVDHYTYVLAGDGDLMEGVSHEAVSLAGHLRLDRLIVLFDDNAVSIDGPTSLADSTDTIERFNAAGWHTLRVDGHDAKAITEAIEAARADDRPSLIACRTIIGYGAPNKQGTAATHGSPLGADEVQSARLELGWTAPPFEVPAQIRDAWRIAGLRSGQSRRAWEKRLVSAEREVRNEFERRMRGELPSDLPTVMRELKEKFAAEKPEIATRKASEAVLDAVNPVVPETIGGSADLTGSNNTRSRGMTVLSAGNYAGRFIHYGVREHAMAAAMNGMALHGGVIPYSGTFLTFSDYCRPSIRLAALMGIRVIHVMTHDSIGLGEDGPTHQPVEHLASLRAIPYLNVFRPADAIETAECWQLALASRHRPSVLALTRQNVAPVRTSAGDENRCARGAYELVAATGHAVVTLYASGSEVALAIAARTTLERDGIPTRVVSVPCFELFEEQSTDYRRAILDDAPVRVAVEAAIRQGWDRFIGRGGAFVGMTGYGASAPYKQLYEHFGITAEAVVAAARRKVEALRQIDEA
jgi:transketolase